MNEERFKVIAYNAIVLGQLDEIYGSKLIEELGCSIEEIKAIADGDETMLNNLGLGE